MTALIPMAAEAAREGIALRTARSPPVPRYIETVYWWAYVHPNAVRMFEREWLVNPILFGRYKRLRDSALASLAAPAAAISGRTPQVACVYGDLTSRLCRCMAGDARLDVVDVLPVQLHNLANKPPPRALCDRPLGA